MQHQQPRQVARLLWQVQPTGRQMKGQSSVFEVNNAPVRSLRQHWGAGQACAASPTQRNIEEGVHVLLKAC